MASSKIRKSATSPRDAFILSSMYYVDLLENLYEVAVSPNVIFTICPAPAHLCRLTIYPNVDLSSYLLLWRYSPSSRCDLEAK